MFKVFPCDFLVGELAHHLGTEGTQFYTTIDERLKTLLPKTGDYTILQLNTGDRQERVVVKKASENQLAWTRPQKLGERHDHSKGTVIRFINSVYVTVELLNAQV